MDRPGLSGSPRSAQAAGVVLKRSIARVLIAAGLVLLIGGTALWRAGNSRHPAALRLPPSLAELPLSARTEGSAAITEIGRMHAGDFPLASAAVGRYGTSAQATLWVAELADEATALQMAESMRDRIAAGGSPFFEIGHRARGNEPIHELEGMGQTNFFYPSGRHVIWLGADPVIAGQALRDTLEVYP